MLDPVGSTSWHNRHLPWFRQLAEVLARESPTNPTVMVVGPGAVTWAASWLLNDAANERATPVRKLLGDAARYSDQLLRRIPVMPLRSLEPVELERTIMIPHRLIVIDRSRRVLTAVARQIPSATCYCQSIETTPPPEKADAIVAFNVVCRLNNPVAGLNNIVSALRPGGWLLIDDRSAQGRLEAWPEIQPAGAKMYRRAG